MKEKELYSYKSLLGLTFLVFILSTQLFGADKSIADATANPSKVEKMVWFGPAPGQIKKLHDIGLPDVLICQFLELKEVKPSAVYRILDTPIRSAPIDIRRVNRQTVF